MKIGVLFLDLKCLETDVIGMLIRIDQRFMNRFCMKKPPQFVILLQVLSVKKTFFGL